MWWYKHIWIIAIQIIAFAPYIIGSHRFYIGKKNFMAWIAIGLILDFTMAISPIFFELPRMENDQGAPWTSFLFILHIFASGVGMFGFFVMFVYLIIKGTEHYYGKLRRFQYKILLRLWILGVSIALVNFLFKIVFNIRIYDFV
jgi:hypothetical protein